MKELIEEINEINEDNDIFGTYQKAKAICEFLELDSNKELLEKNNLLAIYGPWGCGKSCLMKTMCNKLDCEKFDTVWFDTWKYEKDDNLAYSLFKYIGNDRFFKELKEKNILSNVYGIFKSLAKGVDVNFGALNLKPGEVLDELENRHQKIRENIENQKCLWEKIKDFENVFQNIVLENNKKLVVFLDDLDRCESENIITLISAIKLLMSINKNIIYIVGIDKNAVTLALKNKYGNDYNKADEYLEKIFSITFDLSDNIQTKNFLEYIIRISELEEKGAKLILEFFQSIHFLNARHIKKVLRKYYMMKIYLEEKGIDIKDKCNVLLIIYLIILNIYYDDEYKYIIQYNKEKIYQNIIFYSIDKNGMKNIIRYNSCKKICNIKYDNSQYLNIYKILSRFSSYKIVENEIRNSMNLNKEVYFELENWLCAFDRNNVDGIATSDTYIIKDNEINDDKIMNIVVIVNNVI